ncbi:hypothetical protein A3A54_02290 [Candidatus Curtissbacteria bacterium RIFCSPLOWO2_01_FULL_39_62]|uniref:HD domain-containing protein n=2 Tax=Candidatus Curtissiibacteriota TaxID=1752717 RepID=A0A1F5G8U3_9BACT|nr:MAG: hypothetical protein A2775_02690 [Candidatus Curtissbacteria bacterium RIFCSPHIGHO2_01_FULL_39_57]OGD88278.1 MAG: hypothetical protein A3D04_00665 [Candidatus Curtissbacteria bacterium RIFCSPHIGHO2_02_FULL_40_16b]OGD90342.1 MAG: hypothetical protein A3E11_00675 [Candidatus Curtissbacteria bacterium RIFCSPHIGHO2_12_FULL_38_37]OGE00066.1 MAG: hypothetical protein A3J17_05270 [Candidatus Curtissbacteria bacterium RIFCSPLOWO2_02_FULL_40_11]OGE00580.1 MAG: hypothetical protein A3A54_02290 [C
MNKNVLETLKMFENGGYEVAVVGGAVRDILARKQVGDWDLTTNATPEKILKLFPTAFYNNRFGTVGIKVGGKVVEATTYRKEQKYSDSRHPDKVVWGNSLEEDLARRDFTINAIALKFVNGKSKIVNGETPSSLLTIDHSQFALIDPYGGQKDLGAKLIRTVGGADERFSEDALRLLRAIRFAAGLGFELEEETKASIKKNANLISKISGERIRDELFKIIKDENNAEGILLAKETGLLAEILPELSICFEVEQKSPKRHHIFDVGTHCVMSMKYCPSKDTLVLFSTLLHDIGKAKVADVTHEGVRTFYNHEVVGARLANQISKRLHFSNSDHDKLFKLVRWHQFSVNENQTDKAIRRFIRNVGLENVEDMMDLRIGDRLGGGLQQPESWRLKLFRKRLKDVLTKPFTVADLKVDGNDVMEILNIKPGLEVGEILQKLFKEVEEDSKKNERQYLLGRIKEFKA